jgi:polyhydroxybutyrate depolymerase
MKSWLSIISFLLFCFQLAAAQKLAEFNMTSAGVKRTFFVHVPESKKDHLPVLLAFHGGGGTALNAEKQFGFSELADQYGYIVVYPQGMNNQWNDGRTAPAKGEAFDDVQFVRDILGWLPSICIKADTSMVFITGISNGGFFSIFLAYQLNGIIDAVAPVCASIPRDLGNSFSLRRPVPLLLMAGTDDPLVKYQGGWVGFRNQDKGRGYSMPIEWTVNKWLKLTGTNPVPVISKIPDTDRADGCTATKYDYYRKGKPFVSFVKIENGGHAWPGGRQYLPQWVIGRLCNDFSASQMIIDFFNTFKVKKSENYHLIQT